MSKKRYTTTMGKRVQQWLLLCMALVAIIVLIGGITRLTGSGLSMVDWKPILGSIPPLSSDDWAMAFNAYKQSPEYIKINAGMTLNEFKFIFFWEYLHRMIGRCIGLIAVVPFLYFLVKKQLSAKFTRRWLIIISLIGCQGLMGWFMVKSGLVNNPHVSHFRLAAHLSLAFLIFSLILKDYLRIVFPIKSKPSGLIWAVTGVLGLQIVYGAFTAGLHAGKYYTTYPTMGGQWFPDSALLLPGGALNNFLNNPIAIQWVHRWLAVAVVVGAVLVWQQCKKSQNIQYQYAGLLLIVCVGFQFLLGIATLVSMVWVPVALAHQFGALALLSSMVIVGHLHQPIVTPS